MGSLTLAKGSTVVAGATGTVLGAKTLVSDNSAYSDKALSNKYVVLSDKQKQMSEDYVVVKDNSKEVAYTLYTGDDENSVLSVSVEEYKIPEPKEEVLSLWDTAKTIRGDNFTMEGHHDDEEEDDSNLTIRQKLEKEGYKINTLRDERSWMPAILSFEEDVKANSSWDVPYVAGSDTSMRHGLMDFCINVLDTPWSNEENINYKRAGRWCVVIKTIRDELRDEYKELMSSHKNKDKYEKLYEEWTKDTTLRRELQRLRGRLEDVKILGASRAVESWCLRYGFSRFKNREDEIFKKVHECFTS